MASSMKVTIKFGKKKHKNVEIKSSDTFDDIQGIIFSLTQVTPERQKIIIKGKKLENDDDVKKLIKNKILITVMGSVASSEIKSSSSNSSKFVEDMTDAEKQKVFAELPPGLYNLGNTCYLNSCIQCVKGISELKEHLKMKSIKNINNNNTLCNKLGNLMLSLDTNSDTVLPQQFVQFFRGAFPRFASRNDQGQWEQQDADEAYTEIISNLRQDANFIDDESKESIINDLFEGEFETKTKCTESQEEPISNLKEKFIKLQCFIDSNTRHINDGLGKSMKENVEKRSDKLDRNAIWEKEKKISNLPKYIPIQLVRFFWKAKTKKNAKILRKVIFPEKLDIYEFCNESLKKNIEKYRKLKLEKEDAEREKKQAINKQDNENKENKENKENEQNKENKENEPMDVDDNDNDNDLDVDNDEFSTGYYELVGIVTHKGRSANSGHYIGYTKDNARKMWLKCDDETVTEIKSDDIKQLYGGGDFQMAFLCIYKRTEPTNISQK